ncbi:hypothetical protein DM02DRAFT_610078 [Periconia macrospinosa]|uniref:C4-dicarboxylate/malic acid transporter n=1 Tax=Periconia macrospinosa TaxID=97972 RepID=A0A2V1E6K5_9PLEO|nr:hypothetical protein DM02DRAFT_610078 [Periconia macrospinosa]
MSLGRTSSKEAQLSAAERLQWRNQQPLASPFVDPDSTESELNPFDRHYEQEWNNRTARDSEEKSLREDQESENVQGTAHGRENQGDPSGNGEMEKIPEEVDRTETPGAEQLSWRERMRHFTWTWFTMTMATGGIANVLYTIPYRFQGIYALGCIFFILNMVLFVFNVTMISLRFYWFPKTFKASFLHPTESLFIPAAVISFGTILINISQYGVGNTGYWLEKTMCILYWCDCGLAICFSIIIYLVVWSTQTFTISQMTPVWIFPAYPLLIIGPHAGNLAPKVSSPSAALQIIFSGFVIQGIGFFVSLMVYSAFIYRLMTQKLPKESLRPGMFISVGPSGFTIAGIVNMGQELHKILSRPEYADFMGEGLGKLVGDVAMISANFMGLWLWGLALWFFFVSVGAHWSCATRGKMDYQMTWFSFVFPNTALTTATFAVAKALDGNGSIRAVGCVMTICLVITWFFVFVMMIRAVIIKQILWPQKQEDRTEGGWKEQTAEEQRRKQRDPEAEDGLYKVWSLRKTRRGATGEGNGAQDTRTRRRGWSFRENMAGTG